MWVETIASAVLSGGMVGSLLQIVHTRREGKRLRLEEEEARRRQALIPQQQTSLTVEAAERTVAMLNIALERADRRVQELELTVGRLREEVIALREELLRERTRPHDE